MKQLILLATIMPLSLHLSCNSKSQQGSRLKHAIDEGNSAHVHCSNGIEIDVGFAASACYAVQECIRVHEQVHIDDYYSGQLSCINDGGPGAIGGYGSNLDASECRGYSAELSCLTNALSDGQGCSDEIQARIFDVQGSQNQYCSKQSTGSEGGGSQYNSGGIGSGYNGTVDANGCNWDDEWKNNNQGWGWNPATKSPCDPKLKNSGASQGSQPSLPNNNQGSQTISQGSGSKCGQTWTDSYNGNTFPYCCTQSDPDGDGWGHENNASCKM